MFKEKKAKITFVDENAEKVEVRKKKRKDAKQVTVTTRTPAPTEDDPNAMSEVTTLMTAKEAKKAKAAYEEKAK